MAFKLSMAAWACALLPLACHGQLRLPAFDISLKAGYIGIEDDNRTGDGGYMYEGGGVQGEIHLQLGQRVAIGWVYNRKLFGNYHESRDNNGGRSFNRDAGHLLYGINLRLSGGRSSRLRPYIQGKYYWMEVVVQQNGYRTAADMAGFAGGAGLMLRISNKLYLNIIEGEVCFITENKSVMFSDTKLIFPQIRTGLTCNFSKRK